MKIQFLKLKPQAVVPKYAKPGDAAFDLASAERYLLQPGERHTFETGLAAEFEPGHVALFRDRSGLGAKGITVLAGVIDAGYRGEWKVVLLNTSSEPYQIEVGDRIAQCLLLSAPQTQIELVEQLSDSERKTQGFGSSGR